MTKRNLELPIWKIILCLESAARAFNSFCLQESSLVGKRFEEHKQNITHLIFLLSFQKTLLSSSASAVVEPRPPGLLSRFNCGRMRNFSS